MLERSTRMRFAAAVTALALAAPVWASEIQMKKKEDPNAQKQAEPPKAETSEPDKKKKNCPTENQFNTLEDMFGLVEPLEPLAQLPPQAAGVSEPAIEWRAVEPSKEAEKPEPDKQN